VLVPCKSMLRVEGASHHIGQFGTLVTLPLTGKSKRGSHGGNLSIMCWDI
jgi:hypothetical protein